MEKGASINGSRKCEQLQLGQAGLNSACFSKESEGRWDSFCNPRE